MKKKLFFILAVAFVAIFMVSCGGSSNAPSKTVTAFYDAIKSKNYDKAIGLFYKDKDEKMTDSEVQKVKALLMASQEQMDKKGGIKDVEILNEEIAQNGETATVKVKVVYGDDSDDEENVDLKKVDGKWKMKFSSGF